MMDELTDIKERHPAAAPDYFIRIGGAGKRVRVEFNGEVVAESDDALILRETRLVPGYYFPREDVRLDLLAPTDHHTHCPFKGDASYWDVRVGDRVIKNAAWSYENPFDNAAEIKGFISFYWNRMDAWYEDGTQVFISDRDQAPRDGNPLLEWLVKDSWSATSAKELFESFADTLIESGVPIHRFRLIIRTLHPQVAARAYDWTQGEDEVVEFLAPYSMLESSEYLDSPFAAIIDGAGGVRRRLDIAEPQLDYPILKDLLDDGITDYVAMPMMFSDGQINVISLTTKRPGGFSTGDLGHIYEIMPLLSRLFEAHAVRRTAINLLDTYLGKLTGQRVLKGNIQRGDGDNVHAIIWFCDLRNSTALADTMAQEDFLKLLNQFLEAMAGAVLDAGGEVLRYIGDAALSIFPITGDVGLATPGAARDAANAAKDAVGRMTAINQERMAEGLDPIGYGIGLHRGDVMYGNIGSPERLEFTVIGAAANEAARIEGLTKTLGHPVLMSEEFNHCHPGKLLSVGRHHLRGVGDDQEIFTFPPAA